MAAPLNQGERIARLEALIDTMRTQNAEKHGELKTQQEEIKEKLDDLLAMRNKGIGAFWLVSSLLGTGIIGFIFQLVSWWKHT